MTALKSCAAQNGCNLVMIASSKPRILLVVEECCAACSNKSIGRFCATFADEASVRDHKILAAWKHPAFTLPPNPTFYTVHLLLSPHWWGASCWASLSENGQNENGTASMNSSLLWATDASPFFAALEVSLFLPSSECNKTTKMSCPTNQFLNHKANETSEDRLTLSA